MNAAECRVKLLFRSMMIIVFKYAA